MGSEKSKAKNLWPILWENIDGRTLGDPFFGCAKMSDKVDGKRIGADFNDYLIAMWKELQNGWTPPDFVSEEKWRDVKTQMENKYEKHYIAFVRLGCSFGADWNGGYARNVRKDKPNAELLNSTTKSYCGQSKRNILKQLPNLKDVEFLYSNYQDLEIPDNSLIYCDPPYEGTTKYKDDFNHVYFWEWCRTKAKQGHLVYVSEYNAPKDFECVYSSEINNTLNNTSKTTKATEKLFVYCG